MTSPIVPPKDYALEQARDQLDQALMMYITECEFTGEQILEELTAMIRSTFDYFNKPAQELQKVLDVVDGTAKQATPICPPAEKDLWSDFLRYDDLLSCKDLDDLCPSAEPDDDVTVDHYEMSDRCIQAESYRQILACFEEALQRDVRSFGFDAELTSSEGLDLVPAELAKLWDNSVVPAIVRLVNNELTSDTTSSDDHILGYCFNLKPGTEAKYDLSKEPVTRFDVYYTYNHIPSFAQLSAKQSINTLFDLIHAYESALADHRDYVCLLEN